MSPQTERAGNEAEVSAGSVRESNQTLNTFLGGARPMWMTGSSHTTQSLSQPRRTTSRAKEQTHNAKDRGESDRNIGPGAQPSHSHLNKSTSAKPAGQVLPPRQNVSSANNSTSFVFPSPALTNESSPNSPTQYALSPQEDVNATGFRPVVTSTVDRAITRSRQQDSSLHEVNSSAQIVNEVHQGSPLSTSVADGLNVQLPPNQIEPPGHVETRNHIDRHSSTLNKRSASAIEAFQGNTHHTVGRVEDNDPSSKRACPQTGKVTNIGTPPAAHTQNVTSLWDRNIQGWIAHCAGLNPLNKEIEVPRFRILRDACAQLDVFYLVFHRHFCLWSINRPAVLQLYRCEPQVLDRAFEGLLLILRQNKAMAPHHLQWFTQFPDTFEPNGGMNEVYKYRTLQVGEFLNNFAQHWTTLTSNVVARQYPVTAGELCEVLQCRSPVLRLVLFTMTRRRLGISDGPVANQIDKVFEKDLDNERRGLSGSLSPESRLALRNNTIAQYAELVAHGRQYQGQRGPTHPPGSSPGTAPIPFHGAIPEVASPRLAIPPSVVPTQSRHHIPNGPAPVYAAPRSAGNMPAPQASPIADSQSHGGNFQYAPTPNVMHLQVDNQSSVHRQPHSEYTTSGMAQPGTVWSSQGPSQPVFHHSGWTHHQAMQTSTAQPPPLSSQGGFLNAGTQGQSAHLLAFHSSSIPRGSHDTAPNAMHHETVPNVQNAPSVQGAPHVTNVPNERVRSEVPGVRVVANVSNVPHVRVISNVPNIRIASNMQNIPSAPNVQNVPKAMQQVRTAGVETAPPPRASASESLHGTPPSDASGALTTQTNTSYLARYHRIPIIDYPTDAHDWSSVQPSLHLLHLRSPRRAAKKLDTARYYQYVREFAVQPTPLSPQTGLHNSGFLVSREQMARVNSFDVSPETVSPVSQYFEGSRRYRLRLCARNTQLEKPGIEDWVVLPTYWPEEIYIMFNEEAHLPRRKQHFHRDSPIELSKELVVGSNVVTISLPPSKAHPKEPESYYMAVEVIETARHDSVTAMVKQAKHYTEDETIQELRRRLMPPEFDDIVVTNDSLTVSVADPFSCALQATPVRGVKCRHLECFDLDTWLQTRPRKPAQGEGEPCMADVWKCPICNLDCRPPSLQIDDFFTRITETLVSQGKVHTKRVVITGDGKWTPVVEEDDSEDDHSDSPQRQSSEKVSIKALQPEVIEIDDD